MKILITSIFFLALAAGTALAQREYCFYNGGLKTQQNVSFTITKNKIEGTLESGGYEKGTSAETFDFTGVRAGNLLTVKFGGNPPYERPPGAKKIVWTLSTANLKIPMYGKNYNTHKYAAYTATYAKCKGDDWR